MFAELAASISSSGSSIDSYLNALYERYVRVQLKRYPLIYSTDRYGYFLVSWLVQSIKCCLTSNQTNNSYFVCHETPVIDRIFSRLRNYHGEVRTTLNRCTSIARYFSQAIEGRPDYPKTIGGVTVKSVRDLTTGYDSSNPPSYKPNLPLSSGNMITFKGEHSGTGNKIVLTIRYAANF